MKTKKISQAEAVEMGQEFWEHEYLKLKSKKDEMVSIIMKDMSGMDEPEVLEDFAHTQVNHMIFAYRQWIDETFKVTNMKKKWVIVEITAMMVQYINFNPHGIVQRGRFVGTRFSLDYQVFHAVKFKSEEQADDFLKEFPFDRRNHFPKSDKGEDGIPTLFFQVQPIWVVDYTDNGNDCNFDYDNIKKLI